MADEFLTTETLDASSRPAAAAPKEKTRKRGPMAPEHKEKIRAANKARQQQQQLKAQPAPPVPNVETGITAEDAEEMRQELRLKAAEERIKEAAISEDNRLMVHQEIRADVFNVVRRYVELTPSMCRSRNCPFDAAIEAGATAWGNAPVDQMMTDGKTFGDRLIALREYHEATAHTVQQMNDHILTAGELERRQWGVGQSIKNEFLQGAK